jgi:hypothetical protein
MIKIGVQGIIIKGAYSPNGKLRVEDDTEGSTGGYYIYIWPNDGTKWPGTDKDMVYDIWLENWDCVESQFKHEMWEIFWPEDKDYASSKR